MPWTIRRLVEADVESVVVFSLSAWAPVFAGLEVQLDGEVFGLLFPDWRVAQASAVEATCRAPDNEVWVAVVDDRPVGLRRCVLRRRGCHPGGRAVHVRRGPRPPGLRCGRRSHGAGDRRDRGAGRRSGGHRHRRRPRACPARALYEKLEFTPLHQVRYYRKL